MLNIRVTSILVYTIFTLILVQSTLAFILNAIEPSLDSSRIYAIKDLLIVFLISLMLLTKTRYEICSLDKYVLILICLLPIIIALNSIDAWGMVSGMRFYMMPLVMYLLGRYLLQLKDDHLIEKFILFLAVGYVVLSLVYVFIDREILLGLNISDFFEDKFKIFGRSDAMINGYPVNYFFHHKDGSLSARSFGALFDPLATAFFGTTILCFCYELYKRKKRSIYLVLSLAILLVVGLTFTRAILFMLPVVLLLYGFRKGHVRTAPLLPILLAMLFGIIILALYQEELNLFLDPSTIAHLSVYRLENILSLSAAQQDDIEIRGSESLYLTMIKDYGILFLILYLVLFAKIYRHLITEKERMYNYSLLASFAVYVMASFTTEHWFALSSSSLFWFLLGRNMTTREFQMNKPYSYDDYEKGKVVIS